MEETPRTVYIEGADIYYSEGSESTIVVSIVMKDDNLNLVFTIGEGELACNFNALTMGKILCSVPLTDGLKAVKELGNEYREDNDTEDVV